MGTRYSSALAVLSSPWFWVLGYLQESKDSRALASAAKTSYPSYPSYSDPFFQATLLFKYVLIVRGHISLYVYCQVVYSEISEGGGAIGHWTLASVAFTEKFFKNDAKFHRERDHPLNCPCCYRLVCRKIGTVWFIFDWVSWFVWSTANSSVMVYRIRFKPVFLKQA